MTPHQPTEESRALVESLSGLGVPQDGIAKLLKISVSTLTKWYVEEIEVGVLKANAAVSGNLFRIATGDGKAAATAAFFWLKTRARWRESPLEVEVSDKTPERSADDRARALALMVAKRGVESDGRPH